ncbi:type II toxin-antitoxin system YafQ family toxin [Helicobacter sp. 23-1044]
MSKYKVAVSSKYKKQRKKLSKQDILMVDEIIKRLANGEFLEPKYHDHALQGDYKGYQECHIKPNLLLIYRIYDNILTLYLAQVGSHNELFKK